MRIAIAEGDAHAADVLAFVAQRRGHQPLSVPTAGRLLERLPFVPDALLVSFDDIDANEIELIGRLRAHLEESVIIVLAARHTTRSGLDALKAGAHDIYRGPYNPFEVVYKAEAWAAAVSSSASRSTAIQLADLAIDLDRFAAVKNGKQLLLTKLERRLLYCLCQHYPNIAPIDRLLLFGWESNDEPDAGLLKTHVSHIRKKLREAGGTPVEIVSQQTVGYAIRCEEPRAQAS